MMCVFSRKIHIMYVRASARALRVFLRPRLFAFRDRGAKFRRGKRFNTFNTYKTRYFYKKKLVYERTGAASVSRFTLAGEE